MHRLLTLFLTLCVASNLTAQTTFKPGYLIDESGQRKQILLKDQDWRNNPIKFQYRPSAEAEPVIVTIGDAREFGLNDETFRYQKFTVQIDRSSLKLRKMTTSPEPEFTTNTVFLKQLVEGDADLFYWRGDDVDRYFYRLGDEIPQPLIFHSYRRDQLVKRNMSFRTQLLKALVCSRNQQLNLAELSYEADELVYLFKQYNECVNSESTVYERLREKVFRFGLRAGVEIASSTYASGPVESIYPTAIEPRAGIEVEYFFPWGNNKFSLFLEASYHQYSSAEELTTGIYSINYQALSLPLGFRYHLYINDEMSIFTGLAMTSDLPLSFDLLIERRVVSRIGVVSNINFGPTASIGIKMNNRYSLDMRYSPPRGITSNNSLIIVRYQSLELSGIYHL